MTMPARFSGWSETPPALNPRPKPTTEEILVAARGARSAYLSGVEIA